MEKRKNFRGFEQKCFSIVRRLLKTEFPNLKPDNIDVQLADITRFKQSGKAYVVLEGGNQSNHLTIFINIKYREWLKDSDEQNLIKGGNQDDKKGMRSLRRNCARPRRSEVDRNPFKTYQE